MVRCSSSCLRNLEFMKSKLLQLLPSASLAISIFFLNGTLFLAYHVPKNSYFFAHDFLDHLFVLYKLRGANPHFFDFSSTLPGVLGHVPLNSLGISDLALDANMYVFFDSALAAVLNEFIARNIAFVGMFYFLRKLLASKDGDLVVAIPSMLFALMPYYPNFHFTIAFLPVIGYVITAIFSNTLKPVHIILVIFSSLFGNFTYGGFAVLGAVLLLSLIQVSKGQFQISRRLMIICFVLVAGYLFGILRILALKFDPSFRSHRVSWNLTSDHWFDLEVFPKFLSDFLNVSLKGIYHFPSGQSVFTNQFIPGVPLVLLIFYCVAKLRLVIRPQKATSSDFTGGTLITYFLAAIFLVNIFYASEVSGLTHFENLIGETFQFNRLAVLLPYLWCTLLSLVLNSLAQQIPIVRIISLVLVVAQIAVSNVGVRGKILDYMGLEKELLTINEYFDADTYAGLARKLGRDASKIRVMSFDLDPMIASYNGYQSLDGYVYNYPLKYKIAFRKIIVGELKADIRLREYYDNWGSRVYLFHRDLPVTDIKIDWCEAKRLGTDYILSKKDLSAIPNLKQVENHKYLRLYGISGC